VAATVYLQSILDNLISTHEMEVNYKPLEIEIDSHRLNAEDINELFSFVQAKRNRLFLFKLTDDPVNSAHLALCARKAILSQTAEKALQNSTNKPQINPFKLALHNPEIQAKPSIQIQMSFELPKSDERNVPIPALIESTKKLPEPDRKFIEINLSEVPLLVKQLTDIGIKKIQDTAAEKIKQHLHAFTDGIIPKNMPTGFYIDKEANALCYTPNPSRLPSALAPVLEKPLAESMITFEQARFLLGNELDDNQLESLLNDQDQESQKNTLLTALSNQASESKSFLVNLSSELNFLVPILARQYIQGGEAHLRLLTNLINGCLNKKINLDFIKAPEVQNALLNPRGIKNLQKLIQLPAEQREWWNTLAKMHLGKNLHHFDFNGFFESYKHAFLSKVAEKNLTLSTPCPIQHNGHFLITLNRVLDVLENAQNPQEQCLNLDTLNWGPSGAHFAMLHAAEADRFEQVSACMNLQSAQDVKTDPEKIQAKLDDETLDLKPWLYRYFGQHWKKEIRLTSIDAQLEVISQLRDWSPAQKNKLTFILTCTFSDKATLNASDWNKTLIDCINSLQDIESVDRKHVLDALSYCYKFKPQPSLAQIHSLIKQAREFKTLFPDKRFVEDFINPLCKSLENEGFELLARLTERTQKMRTDASLPTFSLGIISAFINLLDNNRAKLGYNTIQLLAKINESEPTQASFDSLYATIQNLKTKKGVEFCELVVFTLSQLNIAKSQNLPTLALIQEVLDLLANSALQIPPEHNTLDKQELWFKDYLLTLNKLPGCVFGNGDISRLDDLIVDGLVEGIKKRQAVLNLKDIKASLIVQLDSSLVPEQLRNQMHRDLLPLFDAVDELVTLLLSPAPKFDQVIEKLRFFETKKPALLNSMISVNFIGTSRGDYLLSYILSGKKKPKDNITGTVFATLLSQLNTILITEVTNFFKIEENKQLVKDLDAETTLSWLKSFNENHSIAFLFKEELVNKKVLPALKKTLLLLNTQDKEFENSILASAAQIDESKPSHETLENYRNKIESIANYLNLLIDIKARTPMQQFNLIYKQLQTGVLARINYAQKQILLNKLLSIEPKLFDMYLMLITQGLEENPAATAEDIERAVVGLVQLFDMADLSTETQTMFFKMSLTHNLKNKSPFPLAALNELKKSEHSTEEKTLLIKEIIHLLSSMGENDSTELFQNLVQQIQTFWQQNPNLGSLCTALLKKVSVENLTRDLNHYAVILNQLTALNPYKRELLSDILNGLAHSKKDDTVTLPVLVDITKGLVRRSDDDLRTVKGLFASVPLPVAQTLNAALLEHGSERLKTYCSNFDTNPFGKMNETRPLETHFATHRIKAALQSLKDLMNEADLPHNLQLIFARQLTFIETLGYTDPLKPDDYNGLKQLTSLSRNALKDRATALMQSMRNLDSLPAKERELTQLELLAYLREIYFRTSGKFLNTSQMLMLLVDMYAHENNLMMGIRTGEGKSLTTPLLVVMQWAKGGTLDVFTANRTLLRKDYENSWDPFFTFLEIKSSLITSQTPTSAYVLGGINSTTLEDMALFRLAAKVADLEHLVQDGNPIHYVIDESDDALLDQTTLFKLVAENAASSEQQKNSAEWIYPIAHQFVKLPNFQNIDSKNGLVWDEEEDLEQFKQFINKVINEQYNGDADKLNFMLAAKNSDLKQWINASCKAITLKENKHYVVQPQMQKDDLGNDNLQKIVSVPLIHSTPKPGCIFTGGVQQALQARLQVENPDQANYCTIDADPVVLASQSAPGLINFYKATRGRLIGISGTPGGPVELKYLSSSLGIQAIGVDPYAGDKRITHPPIFVFSEEEGRKEIHATIDSIKKPITEPITFTGRNKIQTFEESEELRERANQAIEEWSLTQTRPVLILCKDFDEANTVGKSLDEYRNAGYTVQVVTGKETPERLEQIVKEAGRANTITVGTAMLSRGIDVNPGDHPEGAFEVLTDKKGKRMTMQAAGRVARNGKPGQLQEIYQVLPPQGLIYTILYYFFPWFYEQQCLEAVKQFQENLEVQASVDRLYTQAIDQAQQSIMQQIENWEELLIELYPDDPAIITELYQWRSALLSELSNLEETSVTKDNLEENIVQFKKSIINLWDTFKEDRWVAKVEKITGRTAEQCLHFEYLRQLDISKEFAIQRQLVKSSQPFKVASNTLMHQNIDRVIEDKAGAVLHYTLPDPETKKALQVAQCRQVLPALIGELSTIYPQTIKKLTDDNSALSMSFLPNILNTLVQTIIETKDKALLSNEEKLQISQALVQFYHKELREVEEAEIEGLLLKIKGIILDPDESLDQMSILEQFKMQGIILTFCTLYGTFAPNDLEIVSLKNSYDQLIMKKLADYLISEFAWANESPLSFLSSLERPIGIDAAKSLYDLAILLAAAPNDEKTIHDLYAALQNQQLILQDVRLFSFDHNSPREVITNALNAIDALNIAPHCDQNFRTACHDAVLSEYHLAHFRECLKDSSIFYTYKGNKDAVWEHLSANLEKIASNPDKNQLHLIHELKSAVDRYGSYPAYQDHFRGLHNLSTQLTRSLEALNSSSGFKQDYQVTLFTQKSKDLATTIGVDSDKVVIQHGCDGMQSYIEVQVDGASLIDGFAGYQSTFMENIEKEKNRIEQLKIFLETKYNALVDLYDIKLIKDLPAEHKKAFTALFQLKDRLEEDWSKGLEGTDLSLIPSYVRTVLSHVHELNKMDWITNPVDVDRLKCIVGQDLNLDLQKQLATQAEQEQKLAEVKAKIAAIENRINQELANKQNEVARITQKNTTDGFLHNMATAVHNYAINSKITSIDNVIAQQRKQMETFENEATIIKAQAHEINKDLQETKHKLSLELAKKAHNQLAHYLHAESKAQISLLQKDLLATQTSCQDIVEVEQEKSRFQTKRFFKPVDLLTFEAQLRDEEKQIPKPIQLPVIEEESESQVACPA